MAKTVQERLRNFLGDQALTILQLSTEVDRLREEVVKLDNELRVYQDADPSRPKPTRPPADAFVQGISGVVTEAKSSKEQ